MNNSELISILVMIIPILLSISIHEYAHAYVAYKRGDYTQKRKGRLTLSPFAHIDIFGLISLLLIGFGWGKPVEVDDSNFKNRRKDMLLVSLAGPASNIIFAFVLTILLKILNIIPALDAFWNSTYGMLFITMLFQTISLNIILAVFNMIPLPPLDGSRLLFYFLPSKFRKIEFFLTQHSFIIFIILMITNVHMYVIAPVASFLSKILMSILML